MGKLNRVGRQVRQVGLSWWKGVANRNVGSAECHRFLKRQVSALLILVVIAAMGIGTGPEALRRDNAPTSATRHIMARNVLPHGATAPVRASSQTLETLRQIYGQLPLNFEANQGQAPSAIRFLSRGDGYALFLTADGATLSLRHPLSPSRENLPGHHLTLNPPQMGYSRQSRHNGSSSSWQQNLSLLRLKLIGSNPQTRLMALDRLPGKSNYFTGHNPAEWHPGISTYARVNYSEVYPGVNLVFYGNQGLLEYDFRLAPGADLSPVTWEVQGLDHPLLATDIDSQGNLLVHLEGGTLRLDKPIAYEISVNPMGAGGGRRRLLNARYALKGGGRFGFAVSGHDPDKTLVIDPVLQYSTYLGGSLDDEAAGIAVDSNDNVYITGQTFSINFPLLDPIQSSCVSCTDTTPAPDVFVTKLVSSGAALAYSTYLGGSATNVGTGIAVDSTGNAYVTGETDSKDFPTTSGAFQVSCASCLVPTPLTDAFVTKLDATGNLVYSTYLGGSKSDQGSAIAVDSAGNAYVTGTSGSTDFPTTTGAFQTVFAGGISDAFVAELNPSGTQLQYATYLGGSNLDSGYGIAVDSSGVYVAGQTSSNNFPTANPLQADFTGVTDGFISKLNPGLSSLLYSTYLGGTSNNGINAIAIDPSGNAYVTGSTSSTDFPTIAGAFQMVYGGGASDAFVAKVNSAGGQLIYSSFLGGSGQDIGNGIAVDPTGIANVIGQTASTNFPTANPFQSTYAGNTDAFVTRFVPSGCAPLFSTYFGGHSTDIGTGIAVDSSGNAYVTGQTSSNDFPMQSPFQATTGGDSDAFIARMNTFSGPAACVNVNSLTFSGEVLTSTSEAQDITLTNGGNASMNITGVTVSGDFAESNTCDSTLTAGSNCMVEVTFSPTAGGTRTGTITITDSGGTSPQSIPLTGVGTDFNMSTYPASATVSAGNSATYNLTLTPVSGFDSTVTLKCTGAPSNAACSLSSTTPTMSGSSATTVTVTVSTATKKSLVPFRSFRRPGSWGGMNGVMLLALALGMIFLSLRGKTLSGAFSAVNCFRVIVLFCLMGAVVLSPACGFSSNAPVGTPAGTYTLTITGVDGALQHSTQFSLIVN